MRHVRLPLGRLTIAVKTEHLSKQYGNMLAVNDVNIQVLEGETIALLGPNGAGKTTLLEMLEGITSPTAGSLRIFGLNYQQNADQIRNSIGVSLQETQFYDRQTVSETVRLFMSFYKLPIELLEHTLERFNLAMIKDKFVMHLSGGQKQRLSLAIAMVHRPRILFLDEPTTGLDPAARASLWKLIRELISEGITLLLTTHYMEEAEELCDRVLLLNNGKILSDGTIPELMTRLPGTECVRFSYSSSMERRLLEQVPGVKGIEINHDSNLVTLDVDDAKKVVSYFINENLFYHLKDFSISKRTLNDVFLSLTGTNLNDG